MISMGLQMILNNGVKLPFPLPNMELPGLNLATMHLPDMTVAGIALTDISLPSTSLPSFNPASMTEFAYIEQLMSRAGITFDDLANYPLPDLSNLNLSDLGDLGQLAGGMDIGFIMSLISVKRVSLPNDMVPTPIYEPLSQTTTLDSNDIVGLIGLPIIPLTG
ncbi:hypothetical protein BX661DRAFT_179821 [Kickxella alabastrina]|uniref:uncharacterized protein n=1 Tax=Kickxella alabastrina TaxID=61397 RepID=UPI00221FF393|nr:uncharacterized protein BX661DRAFT_179821 [Kickxella alabastrina]KAI7832110.1 hypothetical protein BX661DRAFT_179821 [Kickxella alabastrina]